MKFSATAIFNSALKMSAISSVLKSAKVIFDLRYSLKRWVQMHYAAGQQHHSLGIHLGREALAPIGILREAACRIRVGGREVQKPHQSGRRRKQEAASGLDTP